MFAIIVKRHYLYYYEWHITVYVPLDFYFNFPQLHWAHYRSVPVLFLLFRRYLYLTFLYIQLSSKLLLVLLLLCTLNRHTADVNAVDAIAATAVRLHFFLFCFFHSTCNNIQRTRNEKCLFKIVDEKQSKNICRAEAAI